MFPVTWCWAKYKSTEAQSNLLGSPAFQFTSAPRGFQLLTAPFYSTWIFIFLLLKPAPQRFSFLLLVLSSSRVVFQPFDSFCFNSTCSLLSAVFELLSAHSQWPELSASIQTQHSFQHYVLWKFCGNEKVLEDARDGRDAPTLPGLGVHIDTGPVQWVDQARPAGLLCLEPTGQEQPSQWWSRLFWFLDNGLFQEMVRQVKHLVAILKLLEDPTENQVNLLDAICQRCSEEEVTRLSHLGSVKMHGLTSPKSCQVLFSDFLLLEAVEGGLGTAVQVVEEIVSTSKPLKWKSRSLGKLSFTF